MFIFPREQGFSLTELMVVLAIMGMALLVGTPAIQGYLGSKRIEGDIDSLISHLDLARHLAAARNVPVEVFFSEEEGSYRLLEDENGNGSEDDGERVHGPHELGEGVALDVSGLADDARVVFQPSGVLSPGQGGIVLLVGERGDVHQVEVFNSGTVSRHR